MIRSFFHRGTGQGLVEYALILALIAIVVIGVLQVIGSRASATFQQIGDQLPAGE